METMHIQVHGVSALLMNNPAGMLNLKPEEQTVGGRKGIPKPEEAARASRYVLPDGNLFVQAVAVRNSLLSATKGQLINRRRAMPFISGGVLMLDEAFPLYRRGKPIAGDDYAMDVRRAVIQGQGITRVRAKIEVPWELDCVFDYNKDIVDIKVIEVIAKRAGQIVGIGDYRVEKTGWFGRFEVDKIFVG